MGKDLPAKLKYSALEALRTFKMRNTFFAG